jgi:tRNA-dihydrouridine synthase
MPLTEQITPIMDPPMAPMAHIMDLRVRLMQRTTGLRTKLTQPMARSMALEMGLTAQIIHITDLDTALILTK